MAFGMVYATIEKKYLPCVRTGTVLEKMNRLQRRVLGKTDRILSFEGVRMVDGSN